MQKSSKNKALARCALMGFVLSLSPWDQAVSAAEIRAQDGMPNFGMLGVIAGQTARLNLSLDRIADQTYPPDPYRVTLYFLNGDGRILSQQTFPVSAGQSAHLDYAAPAMPFGLRQRIRPVAIVEPDQNGNTPDFRSVVEVIGDDSERNVLVYPGRHNPPSNRTEQGHYDSGFVGIARGQVARLNVINTADIYNRPDLPPDPYRVTLSFYGGDGRLLAQTTKVLAPGQAAALDVNPNNFPRRQGSRLEIHAVVSVAADAGGLAPCVMPTLEVFDAADGKTAYLVPAN